MHAALNNTSLVLAAIEQLEAGLIILDNQFSICYCNQFVLSRLTNTSPPLLGRKFADAFPETHATNWHAQFERARNSKTTVQTIWRNPQHLIRLQQKSTTDEDPQTSPMQQTTLLYYFTDEQNTPFYGIAIFDNSVAAQNNNMLHEAISRLEKKQAIADMLDQQRKQTNERVLQAEKMAAIGQLAAGVAHEINNPTGFISTNLKILADYIQQLIRLVDDIQEQGDQALAALKKTHGYDFIRSDVPALLDDSSRGIKRIKNITSALHNFAQYDPSAITSIDLIETIESALNELDEYQREDIEVIKLFAEQSSTNGNRPQIKQAVINLLVNAFQSINGPGSITVSTYNDDGNAYITVEDSGCGIPAEISKRIFEPFFTTKAVGDGIGLGLTTVFNITTLHQGQVSVSSTPGKGSIFTLALPCTPLRADNALGNAS